MGFDEICPLERIEVAGSLVLVPTEEDFTLSEWILVRGEIVLKLVAAPFLRITFFP